MFGAQMRYLTIGRTGVVYHSPGMDTGVRMELDGNGLPTEPMQLSQYSKYYHTLSDNPTFRFELEKPSEVTPDSLYVLMDSWYANQCVAFALNAKTGEWDEITLNKGLNHPEQYLDAEGCFYCQFRPLVLDAYTDIPTPLISMEGRTAHAAD